MTTTIFYYTGTGNSLWFARRLASFLEETTCVSMKRCTDEKAACSTDRIGLVFPVHIWGVPPPVVEFVRRLNVDAAQYLFALAVNAGQPAATLIQLQGILREKQLRLSSGFSINLPSNYIPWGGAPALGKQQKKFDTALDKLNRIAEVVRGREERPPEKGPFWQNWALSAFYRISLSHVATMDKPFFADEKCNACGICEKICPARNIGMEGGKPVWNHHCEQCFACIQWCPEEAIQYGKGTRNKKRYRHTEISLKDMLASVSSER